MMMIPGSCIGHYLASATECQNCGCKRRCSDFTAEALNKSSEPIEPSGTKRIMPVTKVKHVDYLEKLIDYITEFRELGWTCVFDQMDLCRWRISKESYQFELWTDQKSLYSDLNGENTPFEQPLPTAKKILMMVTASKPKASE